VFDVGYADLGGSKPVSTTHRPLPAWASRSQSATTDWITELTGTFHTGDDSFFDDSYDLTTGGAPLR
jgi:hypothetical protein